MSTIGTNIGALNASFYLTINNESLNNSIRKLSAGSRLANPWEDAAGVAVSGKLDAAIVRMQAASEGAQNVVSFAQTSDGFLSTIQEQLTRMSELAQRATNGSFGSSDLANYNTEFSRLRTQIQSILGQASFNGSSIFQSAGNNVVVAINAQGATDSFVRAGVTTLTDIGLGALASISTTTLAVSAITTLTNALQTITNTRAAVNADISKFNFIIGNIRTEKINVQAANSRIKDIDVAEETTNLSKNNILLQASTAMLAQANASQQTILTLLR
jgi:flagellin